MKYVSRNARGFTLIELMVVVAIIGLLAAIAIPNFLKYQLKSRQSEARTNLSAIRTSEVAFNGEHGCYLAITAYGAVVPASGTKSSGVSWAPGPPSSGAGTFFCTAPPGAGGAAVSVGSFSDMGYESTGNVFYRYAVDNLSNGVGVVSAACNGTAAAGGVDVGIGNNGFRATAAANLDGDGTISVFGTSDGVGVIECTPSGTF